MADLQFCKSLPKVELHAHLNGSISDATIGKLIEARQSRDPAWEPPSNWGVTISAREQRTLDNCFVIFGMIHELCITEELAYMVTKEVIQEFAADNVRYLELRTTPRDVPQTGMTKESYIQAVINAIHEVSKKEDIEVRLLLAVDRRVSLTDAEQVVNLALRLKDQTDGIVLGVDLSGDPSKGDVISLVPVFKQARKGGLKLALHLAEAKYSVSETVQFLNGILPDRIGHGTFLHSEVGGSDALVKTVEENNIPIEVCLTSNLKSGTVATLADHHMNFWLEKNHPIAISTDDKGVFTTSLSQEYYLAAQTFNLDKQKLWELSRDSIEYSFADEKVKDNLRRTWKKYKEDMMSGE